MENISKVLINLYRGTDNHETWVLACLSGMWVQILGAKIASVCHPVRFHRGCLMLEVLDPAWESPLQEIRTDLLKKLRDGSQGGVRQIAFVARPGTAVH